MQSNEQPLPRNEGHAKIVTTMSNLLADHLNDALRLTAEQTGLRLAFALCLMPVDSCEAGVVGNVPPGQMAYILECSKVGLLRQLQIDDPAGAQEAILMIARDAPLVSPHTRIDRPAS